MKLLKKIDEIIEKIDEIIEKLDEIQQIRVNKSKAYKNQQ